MPAPSTDLARKILILSAPSGAGKTSLAHALAEQRDDVGFTVSHTTRDQRQGEIDGVHYHFVNKANFEALIDDGGFIEFATVFEHYYGTSIEAINRVIEQGKYAVLDIDWQGARRVRQRFPTARSVFIMPPSLEALEERLRARRRDSDDVIDKRMQTAVSEMSHAKEYQHVLVNDNFDDALAELERILTDES